MVTENSNSGDITVVTAAILEVAQEVSQSAIAGAVPSSVDPMAAQCCQNGICPVSWKPHRPAAA